MTEVEQVTKSARGSNGKSKAERAHEKREVVEQPAEPFIGQAYLVDVEDLRKTVQELGQQLANADMINDQVHKICDSLESAGVKPEVIEMALRAQFGKTKGARKRGPNRGKDPEPTQQELDVLAVLTSEPMRKREVLTKAKISENESTNNLLSNMQRYGWAKNIGGKGTTAGWTITSKGKALLDD